MYYFSTFNIKYIVSYRWKNSVSFGYKRHLIQVLCRSFYNLLFSHQVISDSLWPHGLQHARPLCLSPSPGVCPSSCPLNQWCHPPIFIDRFKSWKREFRRDPVWPAFFVQWEAHQSHKRDSVCCFCFLCEYKTCSSVEIRMGVVRIWQPWWGILSIEINQISKILYLHRTIFL